MDDIDRIPEDLGKLDSKYRRIVDADHNQWEVQRLAACEIKKGNKILIKDRLYPVLSVDKHLGVDDAYVKIDLEGSMMKKPISYKLTELFWVAK